MAIDSEKKRASVVALSLYCMGPSVRPDGGLDAVDRAVIGYGFGAVLAAIVVTGSQHIGHQLGTRQPTEPSRSNARQAGR